MSCEYNRDFVTAIRPGRLSWNLCHLLISVFTLLVIEFAAFSKLFRLLLISIPKIVALFLNSKPRSIIFGCTDSTRPTGMRTVFSMLQHNLEISPNFSRTNFTFFSVASSSSRRQLVYVRKILFLDVIAVKIHS